MEPEAVRGSSLANAKIEFSGTEIWLFFIAWCKLTAAFAPTENHLASIKHTI